ncbi:ATP-binding protein [Arcobacter sp. FWKO B]|uniref:ATP-binding protein n=1 Tax=Arcobacter sp. FWKO B TaxID=2593672 RepID=UPI0018A61150|nr:ATP-binding protein [Arcobacter sp. FWKO B]QOG12396.1 GHKL domain-containing protein [Arcobacter sp. FWKO B]
MNKKTIYATTLIVLIIILTYGYSDIKKRFEIIEHEKYTIVSDSLAQRVQNLISDKQSSTLAIALTLSQNSELVNSLKKHTFDTISLDKIATDLKKMTDYKNVWIQILDTTGTSLYRSWIDKKGDNVYNIRADVREVIKTKQLNNTISVGIFTMTFKSMVPIFDGEHFIGIVEIITHFNSIAKRLELDDIQSVVLVDKKFKSQLTHSITNTFINDYYVALFEINPKYTRLLLENNLERIINLQEYEILDNYLVKTLHIKGIDNELLGYYILFKDIDTIEKTDIKSFKLLLVMFIIVLILSFTIFIFLLRNYEKSKIITSNLELQNKLNTQLNEQLLLISDEKTLNRNILDAQSNLVILSDGEALIDANKATFDIIIKKESIDGFLKARKCICDYFIDIGEKEYLYRKYIDNKNWLEYIFQNQDTQFKAVIEYDNILHHFKIRVKPFVYHEKDIFIVTLDDITHEIEIAEALKIEIEEGRKKDLLLQQQSRLAALGEMIGNIAHQWRQPLSAITSSISGLKVKQEFGLLEADDIEQTSADILRSANFLSKTIDDFRNFFKKDKQKNEFIISDVINETYNIIKASYQNHLIEIQLNLKQIPYYGYPGELSQVLLNILNNAKEAILSNKIDESSRFVEITLSSNESNIQISIKDSGGGINEDIIPKIFDPYFTTKHQTQGTGLGLYMSNQIIKNSFNGTIYVTNDIIKRDNKEFKGANFIIELPIQTKDENV